MSCMFYFNWWEYFWESKFFSGALSSAAWYRPRLPLLVLSLSCTEWGRAGTWTPAMSISGTLLVTLPHTLQLPTAPKQQAIRACSSFSLGQKGKSWGLRCPHHDNTVTLGLNLEQGSGSHHGALSSQVLFAAISYQKNKKRGSERTGYGIYSSVLILSARNIKHKANELG